MREAVAERSCQPLPAALGSCHLPELVAQHRSRPDADLYAAAAVAVAVLVERHGVERLLDYFTHFATRQDRAANFQEAFGETIADFDRAFRAHIWPPR